MGYSCPNSRINIFLSGGSSPDDEILLSLPQKYPKRLEKSSAMLIFLSLVIHIIFSAVIRYVYFAMRTKVF